jgi:hypothetical protein
MASCLSNSVERDQHTRSSTAVVLLPLAALSGCFSARKQAAHPCILQLAVNMGSYIMC